MNLDCFFQILMNAKMELIDVVADKNVLIDQEIIYANAQQGTD